MSSPSFYLRVKFSVFVGLSGHHFLVCILDCSMLSSRRFKNTDKHSQTFDRPNDYKEPNFALLQTIGHTVWASDPWFWILSLSLDYFEFADYNESFDTSKYIWCFNIMSMRLGCGQQASLPKYSGISYFPVTFNKSEIQKSLKIISFSG